MKKLHIVLISFLSLISFSSCEHFGELKKPEAVIAVLKNGNVDYWQQIGNAIIEECNMNGVTPIITYNNENADAKGQLANIVRFDELRRNFDIKGIMAQNTFEMGHQSVKAILKGASSKNIYIPTIYITSDNIKSEEARPFLYYYNLN